MKRLILILLAICLTLCALPAMGEDQAVYYDEYYEHDTPDTAGWVAVNGDSNVRVRPDLDAPVLEVAYSGSEYEYMDRTEYDSRGVAWYCVYCKGYLGWISSRYTELKWPTFY